MIFDTYETRAKRWSENFGLENMIIKSFDKLKKTPGLEKDLLANAISCRIGYLKIKKFYAGSFFCQDCRRVLPTDMTNRFCRRHWMRQGLRILRAHLNNYTFNRCFL